MAAALRLHLSELNKLVTCCLCNGLMKLATSLYCNHHFCMACILQFTGEENTSTPGTCCPKCNLPVTKRQAIYSPEFDKLVAIYQGLELGLACLRPCCRESYGSNDQEKRNATNKAKKKRRRNMDAVVSLNQRAECVMDREKEGDVSLNQRSGCTVDGKKGALVAPSNKSSQYAVEEKEAAVVPLTHRLPCVVEMEKGKNATVAFLNEQLPLVMEGEKEAAVVFQKEAVGEKSAFDSLNQRSACAVDGEKEAAVFPLTQRLSCAVIGEKEAAVFPLTQRISCAVKGEKESFVEGVKSPNVCLLKNKKKRKRITPDRGHPPMPLSVVEGEVEAAADYLNQRPGCAIEKEKEDAVFSLTQGLSCVVEGEKEASVDGVEDPKLSASKKKKKRKSIVPYRGHLPMSKRVQLPCPISRGLEDQEDNLSFMQKTCPLQSEPLQENTKTAVSKMMKDRLCLPCKDVKGNLVIGDVIGIVTEQDHTGSFPTSNQGIDSGSELSKIKMELDLNLEALAECSPKQKVLALDEISCVFCQTPNDSLVAGLMMHYAKGVPVQAGRRIKSLVSVHQHCAEWAPNVYYEGDTAKNLGKEVARGQKLKCSRCGLKGAVLGCLVKRCIKSYHYPCARSLSCRWDANNFLVLCPDHVNERLPCDEPMVKSENVPSKLKTTSGKLPQLAQDGQTKVVEQCNNTAEKNQTQSSRQRKAEKPAAEDIVPSCTTTTAVISSRKEASPLVARELVLCGSGLNSKAHGLLVSFMKQTGARLTKTWNSRVTHLIMATDKTGAAARTLKFMLATLAGAWIVKSDWLEACLAACQLVGEVPYEVSLDIHGVAGGPMRARVRAASKTHKLLENIEFCFLGDFPAAYKMDLQALVSTAGGRTEDNCWNTEEKMQTCTRVVVYDAGIMPHAADCREAIRSRWSQAKSVARKAGAHVVAHTWIPDTIAGCELQPFH